MPDEFGRYELQDLLGRGGMGEVYRALDTVRDRTVALKLLSKHLAADESFKTRFRRESRMVAKLNEPHIIPIHDFGEIEGQLFIDMRLVEGDDLGTVLENGGALAAELAVAVIAQVASALDAAHRSGLVHRDVKPSNVLLTGLADDRSGDPFAYLVDFGIARSSTQEGTALTATTGTVGTVAYMSPERIGGDSGDRTTDIYALACVLYEMLTGHKPFDGELFAMMYAHMHTAPPKVTARVPDAPPGLDEVVGKGMSKNPADRYASAGEFARAARAALRAAAQSGPPPLALPSPPRTPPPPRSATPPPPRSATPPPPPAAGSISPAAKTSHQQAALSSTASPLSRSTAASPATIAATPPPPARPVPAPWFTGSSPLAGQPPRRIPPPPSGPVGWPGPDRGSSQWNAPPSHPSGPIRPYETGPPKRTSRRQAVIAGVTTLLLIAIVTVAVIAVRHGGSTTATKPGPSSPPVSPDSGAGVPTSLNTGGSTTPKIDWAHFASFSKLLGTKDGDTGRALKNGSCKVEGPAAADVAGLVDQVECTLPRVPVKVFVGRFLSAQAVQTYLGTLTDSRSYTERAWTFNGNPRGLEYISPASDRSADIISTICALPTYVVQFYVTDKAKLDPKNPLSNYWGAATFPDAVPPSCNDSFTGALGEAPTTGAGPTKSAASIGESALAALLVRNDATLTTVPVAAPGGFEIMVMGQKGSVSFWSWDNYAKTLAKVGASTYPYDPKSVGPPQAKGNGTVLSGTVHATFIVTGIFSGDGSGRAVAYTTGRTGWGAIKALPNGNIAPSSDGVTFGAIGLENEFVFVGGQLETAECSATKPIAQCGGNNRVLKFWAWDSALSQFTLSSTAGLPK